MKTEPAEGSKAIDATGCGAKRKRSAISDEALLMSNMTEAVNNVAAALRETGPAHADGFSEEALMVVLCHLLDNKSQGRGYINMTDTIVCFGLEPSSARTTTTEATMPML